ncbi:MAG: sulfatase [Bacteroidota bacterium]
MPKRYLNNTFVFLLLLSGFMACQPTVTQQAENMPPQKPNIIFILADDIGQTQLGCYDGPYHTPNIDQFASQSMKFNNAYASAAVCSPTRAALMTGKYPARLHITDFIKGELFPDNLLKQPDWQKFLPLEEKTIAEALKEEGYKTAIFGKWHLSHEKRPPQSATYNPNKQGFDEMMITYKPNAQKTNPEQDPHNVDSITNRALKFLEENKEHRFFLYISHNSIHDPIMESQERISKFENDSTLNDWEIIPEIAAMVEHLDEGTGRLLHKIDDLSLADNTIIIFYGDNGGKDTYAKQHPYRKGKGWLYEGGIREPLLIRYPEKIKAGSESDLMVSTIDFFPTLIDLAGGQPATDVDGRSIMNELLAKEKLEDRPQFWHYPHYHRGSKMKPASAMRKGKYKLIEWHEELLLGKETAYELYDLEADVSETHNLSEKLPDVLAQMKKELSDWKEETGAQMPTLK